MSKILFIVPPHIRFSDFVAPPDNVKITLKKSGRFGAVITDIPLGVLSLSAYLKQFIAVQTALVDFNVILNKLDDFHFKSFKDFFRKSLSETNWLNYSPDIIGISSLFTSSYQNMLDIAECCREIFPKAVILAGGGVPANMYKEIFKSSKCFDALCYGEGEEPLLGVITAQNKSDFIEKHSSWITKKKIELGEVFQYQFIENLDNIPFLDYGILKIDEYMLNPTIQAYPSVQNYTSSLPIMASRGCTHHCCFCASHTIHGRKMRFYSIPRVKEDLLRLREQYGVKTVIFQDDQFMANKKRALEIIQLLNHLQMTAFFPNSLALYALDRKILEALKSVGVEQLILAIESGSNRVLKEVMHKPLDLSIVKRVATDCRQLGIYTDVNILLGIPGETKQDIEDSRKFLKTIDANWFRVNTATPLVGSEMFDICVKNGYIKGNYLECNYKRAVVETEDFTSEYIQEMAYILNLELNFITNSDFRRGDYETALKGFENAIKAKSNHALAYYYAAKCYDKLGNSEKSKQYMNFSRKFAEQPFWRKYFDMFNISI